jgi:hypothetical protein
MPPEQPVAQQLPPAARRVPEDGAPLIEAEIIFGVDVIGELMARTAEMLAMPMMSCGVRRCRRARACLRVAHTGRLSMCKVNLTEDEDEAFYALVGFALCLYRDARDGEDGALLRLLTVDTPDFWPAAAEITRLCLPPESPGRACLDATLTRLADAGLLR